MLKFSIMVAIVLKLKRLVKLTLASEPAAQPT